MAKANLFIVGAMKAGTTTLTGLLANHPEVYAPPVKEPNYFVEELPKNLYEPSRFFSEEQYFKKEFPKSVHIAHLSEAAHYEKLFSLATTEKYFLDASTVYLHAPNAAANIQAYNSGAKIIIITREPLARAFSHYKMDKGLGRTTQRFENIIQDEIATYNKGALPWNSYLGMSFYKEAINQYQQLFKSVLILDFDIFIENKEHTLQDLASFLELDLVHKIEVMHKNKTRKLRFQKLFYLLKKLGLKDYFSKILPQSTRQKLFGMMSSESIEIMQLSSETREKLDKIFRHESP
jgi:hypothetical protein